MVRRTTTESKADAIHTAAMRIIDAEALHRRMKTDRLRQLRLAREAEAGESAPPATARRGKASAKARA